MCYALIQRFGVTCLIAGQRYTKECGRVTDVLSLINIPSIMLRPDKHNIWILARSWYVLHNVVLVLIGPGWEATKRPSIRRKNFGQFPTRTYIEVGSLA